MTGINLKMAVTWLPHRLVIEKVIVLPVAFPSDLEHITQAFPSYN